MTPVDDDLLAWLRLIATPGVGRGCARRLLAAFGSAPAVFGAEPQALRAVAGPDVAAALVADDTQVAARVDATLAWLAADDPSGAPRRIVRLGDPGYPPRLLATADPPLLLHAVGDVALLSHDAIAIVGSRHATPQGLETARSFARFLSEQGLTVVSGMALGIDAAGHQGALDAGAPTVAVVGTGLDVVYPPRHGPLARRIAERGLLLSEYPPGTGPHGSNFPQRNRILAGLTLGTLVVEAAPASGSMITARLAAEAGREVFAVPGSIHALQSRGCHALIRQGAALVERPEEVLEALGRPVVGARMATPASIGSRTLAGPPCADASSSTPAGDAADGQAAAGRDGEAWPAWPGDPALLAALEHGPVSLDALVARTGLGPGALSAALLELELAGRVARLPGQLFQRIGRA